jgi:hypothetical protein
VRILVSVLLVVLAALALALGGAVAHGTTAPGGLSVTPAVLEHEADPGPVGSVTLANTTSQSLKITVTPRPWAQTTSGTVSANRHATLTGTIGVSHPSFTLAAGASESVSLTMRHKPTGGSVYGTLEAIGIPVNEAKQKGVVVGYRLLANLRFDPPPAAARFSVRLGTLQVQGQRVALPVTNTGNTIDPIGGSVAISGGAGTGPIAAQRVLPGSTVLFTLTSTKGLAAGRHVATFTLAQNGKTVANGSRAFSVAGR